MATDDNQSCEDRPFLPPDGGRLGSSEQPTEFNSVKRGGELELIFLRSSTMVAVLELYTVAVPFGARQVRAHRYERMA